MSEAADDIDIEDARTLVGDSLRWDAASALLWDFVEPAAPDRVAAALADLNVPEGVLSAPYPARVKAEVEARLGLETVFHTFPEGDGSRLLLLTHETYEFIAKWIGALAAIDELRRETGREAVRELKAALAGVYPEVFRREAYFTPWRKRLSAAWKAEYAGTRSYREFGLRVLATVLESRCPEGLMARQRLRFAREDEKAFERLKAWQKSDDDLRLPLRVVKLLKPEEEEICCS